MKLTRKGFIPSTTCHCLAIRAQCDTILLAFASQSWAYLKTKISSGAIRQSSPKRHDRIRGDWTRPFAKTKQGFCVVDAQGDLCVRYLQVYQSTFAVLLLAKGHHHLLVWARCGHRQTLANFQAQSVPRQWSLRFRSIFSGGDYRLLRKANVESSQPVFYESSGVFYINVRLGLNVAYPGTVRRRTFPHVPFSEDPRKRGSFPADVTNAPNICSSDGRRCAMHCMPRKRDQ